MGPQWFFIFLPLGASNYTVVVPTVIPELLHSPAHIVANLLVDLDAGTLPSDNDPNNWPIYTDAEADVPDNAITIYNTSGKVEGRSQVDGEVQEHYGIQIRVRGQLTKNNGWPKIQAIKILIDQTVKNHTVALDDSIYLVEAISRTGGILTLGRETPTSKRVVYTLNAIVSIRPL